MQLDFEPYTWIGAYTWIGRCICIGPLNGIKLPSKTPVMCSLLSFTVSEFSHFAFVLCRFSHFSHQAAILDQFVLFSFLSDSNFPIAVLSHFRNCPIFCLHANSNFFVRMKLRLIWVESVIFLYRINHRISLRISLPRLCVRAFIYIYMIVETSIL